MAQVWNAWWLLAATVSLTPHRLALHPTLVCRTLGRSACCACDVFQTSSKSLAVQQQMTDMLCLQRSFSGLMGYIITADAVIKLLELGAAGPIRYQVWLMLCPSQAAHTVCC